MKIDRNWGQTPLQKLILQRRSIRRYLDKPVEREKILTCIESARRAPSAENVQPWRFLVIDDPQLKERVGSKAFTGIYSMSKFVMKAPVVVLVLARLDVLANRLGKQIQNIHFYLIDIGIAGEHFVLQAEELGIGTCWVGWFNPRKTRKVLGIPKKYKIISMLTMGYYEKKPSRERPLKPLEEIAWFNNIDKK